MNGARVRRGLSSAVRALPGMNEVRTDPARAFVDRLFRQYAPDVHRMVASLMGAGASDADIQDLTQQVFLAAYRAAPRFRGDSQPKTWLYGIASKTVLMHLRSRRRHKRLVEALETEPQMQTGPDLERAVETREALRAVWRCLMQIPAQKRIVYVLFEVEGLSGKEIADILEVNEATVRTRLYHARQELLKAWHKTHRGVHT